MEIQNAERLASVETEIKSLKEVVIKVDNKLVDWSKNYVPRSELTEMLKARDKDISDLNIEIKNLRLDKRDNKALYPAWSGVVVALLAILITIFYGMK
ncbi:hypothetical protein [Chengkuizengella marina]|uniref:Uncharacterized protein n=1 Tax=Chengkuizengella marina TaxID=2507566 RepID=A0A6N9Q660_9BACL|nr:hypothetical protein [Chengkuizengella marina]NBI30260.1 hypothetical protein [Chengkuizengella marina]